MKDDFIISVGQLGVVRYSRDNANTWNFSQIQPLESLNNVCIYDSNTAMVSSSKGSLYLTEDGANSWKRLNLFKDKIVTNINCLDQEYGLITGSDGLIAESFGDVDKWETVNSGIDSKMNKSIIFDSKHAFVCGDNGKVLFKDGDASWKQSSLNTNANLIAATKLDSKSALIITDDLTGFWTNDKGKTWQGVLFKYYAEHEKIRVSYLEMVNDEILLEVYDAKNGGKHYNYFAKTKDLYFTASYLGTDKYHQYIFTMKYDKKTQRAFAINLFGELCKGKYKQSYRYFEAENLKYTTLSGRIEYWDALDGDYFCIMNSNYAVIKYTSNSGNSWKYLELEMPTAKGGFLFESIYMYDENTIYVFGNDVWYTYEDNSSITHEQGFFAKIDSDGEILSFKRFENGGGIHGVHFLDKDYGIAYTYTVCHVTKDGGDTWEMIVRPAPDQIVSIMDLTNTGEIVSLEWINPGGDQLFAISDDYGKSWKEKKCSIDIQKFKAFDKSTFIAYKKEYIGTNTSKEHLYLTRDAGETWKELLIDNFEHPTNKKFSIDYEMYDAKIIVVTSADGGKIYISEDYGESWNVTYCNLGAYAHISTIFILDDEPILVFESNVILVSENISDVEDISDLSEALFSIYPNPADKILNIETNDNTEYDKVKIYSIDGKLLLEEDYLTGMSINIEDLQSGNYYLVLTDKEGKQLGRKLNIVR